MEQLPLNLNIVLLGKTGSGKSASGNTILGRQFFHEDLLPVSTTRNCTAARTEVDGQTINVIDTVGLPDTAMNMTDLQTEIEQIFRYTRHGVDVFLMVIKLGQIFTQESIRVMQWIQDNFGAKFSNHTIVLFTQGDELRIPIEDYVSKSPTLRSLVDQCSGGLHVFDNKDEDRSQVTELLHKIKRLRVMNVYGTYTEQDYKMTQDEILQRKCFTGAAVGGGAGAAVGAVAAKIGVVALTVGKAAATGGAALAITACVGMYFFARKYIPRQNQ